MLRAFRVQTGVVEKDQRDATAHMREHIIVIGFGPAGRVVVESLSGHLDRVLVIDMNPRIQQLADDYGVRAVIGDAGNTEVLEHAHASRASVIVVTIPDPAGARLVIQLMRATAPHVPVISRARYHVHALELQFAGAEVIDEERHVGSALGEAVRTAIGDKES
jgi:CPA2 family monovalent cation:H+ antiporter-2